MKPGPKENLLSCLQFIGGLSPGRKISSFKKAAQMVAAGCESRF